MSNYKDLTGMRFGKLVVLYRNGSRCSFSLWRCRCECGNECDVISTNLTRGNSTSCGCENRKRVVAARKKYDTPTDKKIARVYYGIMNRCYNENEPSYCYYGGRGITVCPEWKDKPENFVLWAKMNGYSQDLTIDRINVNGPYSPNNCRWATHVEQANNKRNNRWITVGGETHTIAQWARILGINVHTLENHVVEYPGYSSAEDYISKLLATKKGPKQ